MDDAPGLAFDHDLLISLLLALARLRGAVRYEPIGFELLPAQSTSASSPSNSHEVALEERLDNATGKILGMAY